MKSRLMAFVITALIAGTALGYGSAYFVFQPLISELRREVLELQAELQELENLNLTINGVIQNGYNFLGNHLWNETLGPGGAYQLTPFNSSAFGDDNYLAYIIHTEYSTFENDARANKIKSFLQTNPSNLHLGKRRWVVLSSNFSQYEPYNDHTSYADWTALDGIYFARTGNKTQAEHCFDMIIKRYDDHVELIEDNATEENGHEYYKLALSLILAHHVNNSTYIHVFTRRLIQLQRTDGSWLTDDLDMETTYPNTEATLLILLALSCYNVNVR